MSTQHRIANLRRETTETQIEINLDLDGTGKASIETSIPFLDHMLTLFARHSLVDLRIKASGDLGVDYHHTVEDTGIVLGLALKQALGDKKGIRRYGFFLLPMDESLARVVLDISNRPFLVYQVALTNHMIRDFNVILVREFFQGLATNLGANIHIKLEYGDEPHHVSEAIFKGFARAFLEAATLDPRQTGSLPSTKGLL